MFEGSVFCSERAYATRSAEFLDFVGKIRGFHIRNFGVFGDGAFFTMKIGKSETGRFGVLGRGRLKHYENRSLSARGAR